MVIAATVVFVSMICSGDRESNYFFCNRKGLFINITDKSSIFYYVVEVSSMLTVFAYSSKIILWHTYIDLSVFNFFEFTNVIIELQTFYNNRYGLLSYVLYLVIVYYIKTNGVSIVCYLLNCIMAEHRLLI